MLCLSCLTEIKDGRRLPCTHEFCLQDLQKWSEENENGSIACPTCDVTHKLKGRTVAYLPKSNVVATKISSDEMQRLRAPFNHLKAAVSRAPVVQDSTKRALELVEQRRKEAADDVSTLSGKLRACAHNQSCENLHNALIGETFVSSLKTAENKILLELDSIAQNAKRSIVTAEESFASLLQSAVDMRDYVNTILTQGVQHSGNVDALLQRMGNLEKNISKAPLHDSITTATLESKVVIKVESLGTLIPYDVPLASYMDFAKVQDNKMAQEAPPLPPRPNKDVNVGMVNLSLKVEAEYDNNVVGSPPLPERRLPTTAKPTPGINSATTQKLPPLPPTPPPPLTPHSRQVSKEEVKPLATMSEAEEFSKPPSNLDDVYDFLYQPPSDASAAGDDGTYLDPQNLKPSVDLSKLVWSLKKGKKPGEILMPLDLSFKNNNVYIADYKNNRIQVVHELTGKSVGTLPPTKKLAAAGKMFSLTGGKKPKIHAARLVVPSADRVVISDPVARKLRVLWIQTGEELQQWTHQTMQSPHGISFDIESRFVLTDIFSRQVSLLSSAGRVLRQFSSGHTRDTVPANPLYVAADHAHRGRYFVSDAANHVVKMFDERGTYLGHCGNYKSGREDGDLWGPNGVCVQEHTGNVIVANTWNHCISQYDPSGSFIKNIFTKKDGISSPMGLAISPNNTRLAVSSYADTHRQDSVAEERCSVALFNNKHN